MTLTHQRFAVGWGLVAILTIAVATLGVINAPQSVALAVAWTLLLWALFVATVLIAIFRVSELPRLARLLPGADR